MIRGFLDRLGGLLDRAPSPLEPDDRERRIEAEEADLDPEIRERRRQIRLTMLEKRTRSGGR